VSAACAQVVPALTHPYAYGVHAFGGKSAPCVNAANLPVPCAGAPLAYAGLPYAAGLYGRKKREADASADPYYHHGYAGYAHHGYAGYAHHGHALGLKSAPCVNAANHPVPCAVGHVGHGYYGHFGHYGKRDADAQVAVAGPYAGHLGYAGLGYAGLGYAGLGHAGLGYAGLGHAVVAGIPNPVHAVAHTAAGLVHSSHVGLCTNYLGAAVPCRRKRDADEAAPAEVAAAPVVLGHGLGLHGLGYAGLGYAGLGYAGLGHAGLGYAGLGHAGLGYAGLAHAGLGYAGLGHVAAPLAIAPTVVAPAVVGAADLPNPVHAVAHTIYGAVHSSHVGVCTNYLGEQVAC